MSEPQKVYWDSSCFICFLNRDDVDTGRRVICEDVLRHARNRDLQLCTSTFTIAEVIRPRRPGSAPLPAWALSAIAVVEKEFPNARREMDVLWTRHQASESLPKLTAEEIAKIQAMFEWPFILMIDLDQPTALRAVALARDCGLKPADAVHAASAMVAEASILQKWDRDFQKVAHLITIDEPKRISAQGALAFEPIGPTPDDFQNPVIAQPEPAKAKEKIEENKVPAPVVREPEAKAE